MRILDLSRSLLIAWLAPVVLALAVTGCGQSPTAPDPVRDSGGSTFGVSGEAVIDGEVVSGGSSSGATAEAFAATAADPANIKVTVVGTSISTMTDGKGRFRLANVPGGDLQLAFERSDVNARVGVSNVGNAQHVIIAVEVQGNSATIVQEQRQHLQDFEGIVADVEPVQQILTLEDGTDVQTDDHTWFDSGGDADDFAELETAFNAGETVKVEGRGTGGNGRPILATAIKVEIDDDLDFEGDVTDVDRSARTLTVNDAGGPVVVRIDDATIWDPQGVFEDFTTLADAFDLGNVIEVDGEGIADATGVADILVTEIEAGVEETAFEGLAESVDLVASTLTLDDGTVILIDPDTVWKTPGNSGGAGLGNIDSLDEIEFHLGQGKEVEVEGEGWIFDAAGTLLALEIEAKPVDDDDDDDGDDDGDDVDFSAAIDALKDLIADTQAIGAANGLNGGQINALTAKLQNAIKSLEKGNATPAINQIGAYINQVDGFGKSGLLARADADDLIADAQQIITLIQGA